MLALAAAWAFAWTDEMTRHMYAGYAAATLVVFRLIWGMLGFGTARLSRLARGPAVPAVPLPTGARDGSGHDPVGAFAVLAILALVLTQAGTGLFSNDDVFFDGPWAEVLTKDTSDAVAGWHTLNKNVLIALIALHLAAVAWHHRRGRNVTAPLLTGRGNLPPGAVEPRHLPLWLAPLALAAAAALTGVAFRFWWL